QRCAIHPPYYRTITTNGISYLFTGPKGQSAIPFERMLPLEVENGLFFGWGKPMVAWYPCVVLVDLSKALFPMVELAGRESQPLYELPHGQTGAG
ncbi:MAG: hypothetical protein ACP5O7_01860, partial [Phycisphaerae bacterium]